MTTPKAVRWLNFRGDVRKGCMIGQMLGPNLLGEFLFIVSTDYDAETDRTRVGLSYLEVAP